MDVYEEVRKRTMVLRSWIISVDALQTGKSGVKCERADMKTIGNALGLRVDRSKCPQT